MSHLQLTFLRQLQTIAGDVNSKRFLLTISGGKDSVALAHLFRQAQLTFDLAHCNFHLRGDDSNQDMCFVQELAQNWNVKLHIKEFDTLKEQKKSGKSIEMVARELRYAWFDELSSDYDFIVTAHHANDNAETVLLNLARGTGLKGLTGIPARNGKYLRPFLPYSSEEIAAYIQEQGLTFRTDQSNLSETYHRNRIRHSVLPQLSIINPQIIATFSKNIAHFQQQYAFLEDEIDRYRQAFTWEKDDRFYIDIVKLKSHPHAQLLLYELLLPFHFSAAVTNDIFNNLESETGKQFFSSSHLLIKDRKTLILKKNNPDPSSHIFCNNIQELEKQGFDIHFQEYNKNIVFEKNPQTIYIDAEKLHFPLLIRNWEAGDFFYPFGMTNKKKLSDFFVDQKIDRPQKHTLRILCCGEEIVWIVGVRADNRYRIDSDTKNYYKITYHGRI